MQGILSFTFVLVTLGIADIIADKTKSIISSMFTCSVIFIVGFWLGVPQTLFGDSALLNIGAMLITSLLVHMGTLISVDSLKAQWKTVLVATGAVVGIGLLMLTIGQFLMGRNEALVAAPVISGGVIAALKMQEAMTLSGAPNAESLAVFATVLMVMEGFVGYPIASFMLNKEAKRVKKEIKEGTYVVDVTEVDSTNKKLFPKVESDSQNFYLAKVALVALLATFLADQLARLAGFNIIDKNIMSLLLGILFHELGFLDSGILKKGGADGLALAALMTVVFNSLSNATPSLLLEILPIIMIAQVIGVIGYSLVSLIVGKFLGISPWMSIAIGSTANYGFPGTYVISNEVANAVGDNPDERKQILDAILPKMLVAGFITVSIASVFLASLVAAFI